MIEIDAVFVSTIIVDASTIVDMPMALARDSISQRIALKTDL